MYVCADNDDNICGGGRKNPLIPQLVNPAAPQTEYSKVSCKTDQDASNASKGL